MKQSRNESFNGSVKYQWDQTYDDLTLYIEATPSKNDVSVQFKPNSINIQISDKNGLKQLSGDLFATIDTSESFWLLQEAEVEIHLSKAIAGEVWECVIRGDGGLNVVAKEEEKKKLLLERFQRENPRFDFSDAELNGRVPEPRTFMK